MNLSFAAFFSSVKRKKRRKKEKLKWDDRTGKIKVYFK